MSGCCLALCSRCCCTRHPKHRRRTTPLWGLLPAILLAVAAPAWGTVTTFTDSASFLASLPGPASTATFDSLTSGDVIASGGTADGITFTYNFGGVDLIVTDGTAAGGGGPFDTTSSPNFLGTSDFDILLDGDDLTLGFTTAQAVGLFFETSDCSGTPYIVINPTLLFRKAWIHQSMSDKPIYVTDPDATPVARTVLSELSQTQPCRTTSAPPLNVLPAIPVFVWQDEFTPPFEVITRGELLAMQEGS